VTPEEEGAIELLARGRVGRIALPSHRFPRSPGDLHSTPVGRVAFLAPVDGLVPVDAEGVT
jgi:hypothetical protein